MTTRRASIFTISPALLAAPFAAEAQQAARIGRIRFLAGHGLDQVFRALERRVVH